MELDDKICYCFHISKRKIVNHIRIHEPIRVSQVSECGGAGTGCGWCIPFLKQCFEQTGGGRSGSIDEMTPAEYALQRAKYIRAGHGVPPAGAEPPPDDEKGVD